ncbi:MAG: hypothetical protein Q4D62_07660 [Planctomycetia bacterium]|nr:hypothetical protein [Planctomycetia bacterium]
MKDVLETMWRNQGILFFRLVFLFSSFLLPLWLMADTVEIWNPASERGFQEISGEILEVNRDTLEIRVEKKKRKYPYSKVRKILWEKSPQWLMGDEAFEKMEYANALECYRQELPREEKSWKQVALTVEMIRCLTRLGENPQALEMALQLLRREPLLTDEHYAVLPFLWKPNIADTASEAVAIRWMKQNPQPNEILLCASYLLSSSRRNEMVAYLQSLSQEKEVRLASLAKAQLWRTEMVEMTVAKAQRWEEEMALIPEPLRGGSFFLLGEAWFQCGEWNRAALAYLRMFLLYPDTAYRLQDALPKTATALEKSGHPEESSLLQRVREKFP